MLTGVHSLKEKRKKETQLAKLIVNKNLTQML